jgi:hypothetical protein
MAQSACQRCFEYFLEGKFAENDFVSDPNDLSVTCLFVALGLSNLSYNGFLQ